MDIQERLRVNFEALLEQYHTNVEAVLALQATLLRDILPSVKDELELGPNATEWAENWLYDTSTLFRILKRNNFTRSFAMEAVRKTLIWRLNNLWPSVPCSSRNFLHCLPSDVLDPFNRPIIIIKMIAFNQTTDAIKPLLLHVFESLRVYLQQLSDNLEENPTLQYIVLLDLDGLLLQNLNIGLVAWTIREVIPRFPGMVAGVFILKYSWSHSGLWNIVKRLLPASALSRIFFPTQQELIQYFTPSALPEDYGGTLPFLTQLEDPLWSSDTPTMIHNHVAPQNGGQTSESPTGVDNAMTMTIRQLSSTSLLNPFFGYPASQTSGLTTLPHGRRRKRDLAETLVLLFWMRWRKHITFSLVLATFILAMRLRQSKGPLRVYRELIGRLPTLVVRS
ncbi:hypothetical protein AX17_005721 [Amanita inopinata Kibby_2008]|nr:hypothetical protein AX17_005721 [Amanita inopinata Kibby_2008]